MKKLLIITIAFASIYFIFGCTETGQISGPEMKSTIAKQEGIPLSQLNIIPLPQPANKSLNKIFEKGKFIDIKNGGTIKVRNWYKGHDNKWVEIQIKLKIKKNSINKDFSFFENEEYVFDKKGKKLWFSLAVDDENVSGTFSPHIMFDEPVEFNLKIKGMDLSFVSNPDDVKFVYIPEGSLEAYIPEYEKLKINIKKGEIEIKGCLLQHFSRYCIVV